MATSIKDQQFCLRWDSFHSNMTSSFHSLRSEEEFVDVTLVAEGELIKAHRLVLSACSPFFKKIFKSAPCTHPVVVLNEVRAAHLRSLLSFMYQGQVNLCPDQMADFLRTAQALHVKGLFEDATAEPPPPPPPTPPPAPPEDKENVPVQRPPPLLDTRLVTKRTAAAAAADAAGDATKRPRLCSSPATEHSVKEEPASPPPPESPSDERHSQQQQTAAARLSVDLAQKVRPAACSQASSSDAELTPAHTSYPFPCPFCEKSYTSWGFRRRHIKAFHTSAPSLKCKWCWTVMASHAAWCGHVTTEHHLSPSDAQHAIQILEEANMVLQSSEPLRLDSLVDMVKRQQRRAAAEPATPPAEPAASPAEGSGPS